MRRLRLMYLICLVQGPTGSKWPAFKDRSSDSKPIVHFTLQLSFIVLFAFFFLDDRRSIPNSLTSHPRNLQSIKLKADGIDLLNPKIPQEQGKCTSCRTRRQDFLFLVPITLLYFLHSTCHYLKWS